MRLYTERVCGAVVIRGAVSLTLLSLCAISAFAQASGPPSVGTGGSGANLTVMDKRVNVDADSIRLSDALKTVMDAAGADFVYNSPLRNAMVTAHLTGVKLNVALDTLMKVSSIPVTYVIDHDIFHFSPRVDPTTEPVVGTLAPGIIPARTEAIKVYNVNAGELTQIITGQAFRLSPDGNAIYPPTTTFNNGSVSGSQSYSSFGFGPGGVTSSSYGGNLNYGPGGSSTNSGTGGFSYGGNTFGNYGGRRR